MAAGDALPWMQGVEDRGVFALARLEQRNKFSVGEAIEIMKPDGRNVPVTVEAMYNGEGEAVESCPHARETIWVRLSETPAPWDLLRRENRAEAQAEV